MTTIGTLHPIFTTKYNMRTSCSVLLLLASLLMATLSVFAEKTTTVQECQSADFPDAHQHLVQITQSHKQVELGTEEMDNRAVMEGLNEVNIAWEQFKQLLTDYPVLCQLANHQEELPYRNDLIAGLAWQLRNGVLEKLLSGEKLSVQYIVDTFFNNPHFITYLIFSLDELVTYPMLEVPGTRQAAFLKIAQCLQSSPGLTPAIIHHAGFKHLLILSDSSMTETNFNGIAQTLCDLTPDQRRQYLKEDKISWLRAVAYIESLRLQHPVRVEVMTATPCQGD